MKPILVATLLFSGFTATAQLPRLDNAGKINKLENFFKADTTGEKLRRLENMMSQYSVLPQAKYSHTTSRGKVYNLPIDNMPCLVPDMDQVAPMPGYKMPEGRMPNAIPRQPLIPEEKRKEK
jgi:hypothetical protein